jgi:hypothetical protein
VIAINEISDGEADCTHGGTSTGGPDRCAVPGVVDVVLSAPASSPSCCSPTWVPTSSGSSDRDRPWTNGARPLTFCTGADAQSLILAAQGDTARSSRGQVIDAAIVHGVASLTTLLHGMPAIREWRDERGVTLPDTGRPRYDVNETA